MWKDKLDVREGKMIDHIEISNFRNLESRRLKFDGKLNIIFGENGFGKSNLLESIYFCGFGKSFRTGTQQFVRFDAEHALIIGTNDDKDVLKVAFSSENAKNIILNNKKIARTSQLLGTFPTTFIGPEEIEVASGAPAIRRKLLDEHLCQTDFHYTNMLSSYKKNLEQRNGIMRISQYTRSPERELLIDSIDEICARDGSFITLRRMEYVSRIRNTAQELFNRISGDSAGLLDIKYISTVCDEPKLSVIVSAFCERLKKNRTGDIKLAQTTIGPHRDELEIYLNGNAARKFASRGQLRMISLALYLSAACDLSQNLGRVPTILLDDALAELDPSKAAAALELVPTLGQTIVATPHPHHVEFSTIALKKFIFAQSGVVTEG